MLLSNFWVDNLKEILISSIFVIISIGLLVYLSIVQSKEKNGLKNIITGLVIVLLILIGVTYSLNKDDISLESIILVDALIVTAYSAITLVIIKQKVSSETYTTSKIALLGIIVGLSSVLMLFSIPIFPMAPYLKLEISALVIFMVLLWFDFKSALIVSLLTNVIHAIMPSTTAPVIPFLDEMINFIATVTFILPAALFIKQSSNDNLTNNRNILVATLIGTTFTTIFMVLYNAFVNLPIVYGMTMELRDVLKIFGFFNIIKWGSVTLVINLLWNRLYNLKSVLAHYKA